MMKKRKKIIIAVLFVVCVIVFNTLCDFLLIQPGLARTIFHESEQGEYDCIVLGASHGSYSIDPDLVDTKTNLRTLNMCMGGEFMVDSYYTLKYALKYNTPSVVVLDIDYQYLVNRNKESILFNAVYNGYPDCLEKAAFYRDRILAEDYRGTFLHWTNYWQCYKYMPTTVSKKLSDAYQNYSPSVVSMNKYDTYKGRGFIYRNTGAAKATTNILGWNESKVASSEVSYIRKIVQLCRDKGIQIVFTTVAEDPQMINEDRSSFVNADIYIQKLADSLSVPYCNFNYLKQDVFARTGDDYYDKEGHMFGETAERFSSVYGQVLHEILNGTYDRTSYMGSSWDEVYGSVTK